MTDQQTTGSETPEASFIYPLFKHMIDAHRLTLLDSEMWDIIEVCNSLSRNALKAENERQEARIKGLEAQVQQWRHRAATLCGQLMNANVAIVALHDRNRESIDWHLRNVAQEKALSTPPTEEKGKE